MAPEERAETSSWEIWLKIHFNNCLIGSCAILYYYWNTTGMSHLKITLQLYWHSFMTQNTQSLSWRYNWVTLYMLTVVNGCCCTLKKSPLTSLCNGSSVSATAESDARMECLEWHVGWSETFPEFWGHPRNDVLAATNFEDTLENDALAAFNFEEILENNILLACNLKDILETTSLENAISRTP